MTHRNDNPLVSVVISTAGDPHRRRSLEHAIASVQAGNEVATEILVVLNGDRYCPELRLALEARRDIRLFYLEEGDLTKAIALGRRRVTGRYFCFLDDDDELLPDGLAVRTQWLESNSSWDVLVTNGYRRDARTGDLTPILNQLENNGDNPLMGLTRGNWLASCGGLFRTETVGAEYFLDIQKYFEWTWLAIRLSLTRKIAFRDTKTFIINDTPDSLSKSTAYFQREVDFLLRVLNELEPPPEFGAHLRKKLAAKHIGFANAALAEGSKREAFGHYLACLGSGWPGLSYGLWVRKLLYK